MDTSDPKDGNQANERCTDDTADSNAKALAVDSGEHLAGNNGSDDSPPYLHNQIQYAGKFRWPISHEVATNDLCCT